MPAAPKRGKPWKGIRWVIAITVPVFLIYAAVIYFTGSHEDTSIGQQVRSGQLGFTVNKVEKWNFVGHTDSVFYLVPRGVYLAVWLTVKNVGDQPERFDAMYQELIIDGKHYYSDAIASTEGANERNAVSSENLNPGLKVDAIVVFDVPKGSQTEGTLLVRDGSPRSHRANIRLPLPPLS